MHSTVLQCSAHRGRQQAAGRPAVRGAQRKQLRVGGQQEQVAAWRVCEPCHAARGAPRRVSHARLVLHRAVPATREQVVVRSLIAQERVAGVPGALRAARKATGVACALEQRGRQDRPPALTSLVNLHKRNHSECTRPSKHKLYIQRGLQVILMLAKRHTPGKDGEAALRGSDRNACSISAACTGREGCAAIGDRGSCS